MRNNQVTNLLPITRQGPALYIISWKIFLVVRSPQLSGIDETVVATKRACILQREQLPEMQQTEKDRDFYVLGYVERFCPRLSLCIILSDKSLLMLSKQDKDRHQIDDDSPFLLPVSITSATLSCV